jgi:SAM-dependent methyltransferase
MRGVGKCRACLSSSLKVVLNLGSSPIANTLPLLEDERTEPFYPLVFSVCTNCNLGQIGEFESPESIFSDYPYVSSTSKSWLAHANAYANLMHGNFVSTSDGYVLEIASNDGYLLKNFKSLGYQVLGIDPAQNIASLANNAGINTIPDFFGMDSANSILTNFGRPALIVANNVAAHVPDMQDFFSGISLLLKDKNILTIENPSLGKLFEQGYYDTIYHEHFSYLSVDAIKAISNIHGLDLFRVEELPTHGGSFRYFICEKGSRNVEESVARFREMEYKRGVGNPEMIQDFKGRVEKTLCELNDWVEDQPDNSIIGYGAAAKTVTALYAAGLNPVKFNRIVDLNPLKHNRRLPGTNLSITSVSSLRDDFRKILVFPWNMEEEIVSTIRAENTVSEIWLPNPMRSA